MFNASQLNNINRLFNQITNETYGLERESLDAFEFIPAQTGLNEWTDTWSYKVLSEMGVAKAISDYAEDLPPVSRAMSLKTLRIDEFGLSYGYSVSELMKWLTIGIDLSRDDAETARRKIDEKVDDVLFVGDASLNTTGFINNANVPTVVVPQNAAGTSTKLKDKTLKEIIATIQAMIDTVRSNTHRTVKADTIILPHDAYVYISTNAKSDNSDVTILEFLKKTFADQGLVNWKECSKLTGAGASGADRAIIYKYSPSVLTRVVPVPFKQGDVQAKSFHYSVPCMCRVGGVAFKNINAVAYADGL